jgi:hypothetical protein
MANPTTAQGLSPISNRAGTAPKLHKYAAKASSAFYPGEIVCAGVTAMTVIVPTSTAIVAKKVIGVASHYVAAAATDRDIYVYDDPHQEYEARFYGTTSTALALIDVGKGFYLVTENGTQSGGAASANGTTLRANSLVGAASGTTTITTTTGVYMQFLRFSNEVNQDNTLSSALGIFKINEKWHLFS